MADMCDPTTESCPDPNDPSKQLAPLATPSPEGSEPTETDVVQCDPTTESCPDPNDPSKQLAPPATPSPEGGESLVETGLHAAHAGVDVADVASTMSKAGQVGEAGLSTLGKVGVGIGVASIGYSLATGEGCVGDKVQDTLMPISAIARPLMGGSWCGPDPVNPDTGLTHMQEVEQGNMTPNGPNDPNACMPSHFVGVPDDCHKDEVLPPYKQPGTY